MEREACRRLSRHNLVIWLRNSSFPGERGLHDSYFSMKLSARKMTARIRGSHHGMCMGGVLLFSCPIVYIWLSSSKGVCIPKLWKIYRDCHRLQIRFTGDVRFVSRQVEFAMLTLCIHRIPLQDSPISRNTYFFRDGLINSYCHVRARTHRIAPGLLSPTSAPIKL